MHHRRSLEHPHPPHVARLGGASIRQLRWQYGCAPEDVDRSLARIGVADLLQLAALAADAEAELLERNPRGSGRLLGRAVCQGAALHYVNGKNGVKDLDVWSFYTHLDDWPFPARWRGTREFGPSRLGRYPGDPPQYVGRRVEVPRAAAAITSMSWPSGQQGHGLAFLAPGRGGAHAEPGRKIGEALAFA
jgi:hypothetical protein